MSDKPASPNEALGLRSRFRTALRRLEPRIVLDAAGFDADQSDDARENADAPDLHAATATRTHDDRQDAARAHDGDAPGAHPLRTFLQSAWRWLVGQHDEPARDPNHVLAVSSSLEQAEQLAGAAEAGVDAFVFEADGGGLTGLMNQLRELAADGPIDRLALASHGLDGGGFELAGVEISTATLADPHIAQFWRELGGLVARDGRIDLLACNAGAGDAGNDLLAALETLTQRDVAASTDATGPTTLGGDWILESDNVTAISYFESNALRSFKELLAMPTVSDSDPGATAIGGGAATLIDPNATLTDSGDGTLLGVVVQIGAGFEASEDVLGWDAALATAAGIDADYDAASGTLRFSNEAGTGEYQALLRSVWYRNDSTTPSEAPREIHITVGDDFVNGVTHLYNPETGHYYRAVNAALNWSDARDAAAGLDIGGLTGYLATITSAGEETFVLPLIPAPSPPPFPLQPTPMWIGALDAAGDDAWHWVTGPEGAVSADGLHFSDGSSAVGGAYTNWLAGEPNNAGVSYGVLQFGGGWQDLWSGAKGFLVEFGGDPSDSEGDLNARITIEVETPNHAPVLDASGDFALASIAEDATTPAGTRVSELLASAGGDRVTDYNNDPEGIALLGASSDHGNWQFSLDNGATWQSVGGVSAANALLLRDSDLLRFIPDPNWNGTLADAIEFRAWDQTVGNAGDRADASGGGGDAAFSAVGDLARLTVTPVNDAPQWSGIAAILLNTQFEDVTSSGGTVVSVILNGRTSDPDAGAVAGLAIVGADTSHGSWQYSRDGGFSWAALHDVSDAHALLLNGTDRIRFMPATNWNGSLADALTLRVWDQTAGSAGAYADTTAGPLQSAFSATTRAARLDVVGVNDAPTVDTPLGDLNANEDAPWSATLADGAFDDVDGEDLDWEVTLAGGAPLPSWLSFNAQTRTLSGTPTQADVGPLELRVRVTDAAGMSAEQLVTLTVNPVNDAPVLQFELGGETLTAGDPLAWQVPAGAFFDEDPNDELTLTATLAGGGALPAWLSFDPVTGLLSGAADAEAAGAYEIRITATDGSGASAFGIFSLQVEEPSDPPSDPPIIPPDEPTTPPPNTGGTGNTPPPTGGDNPGGDAPTGGDAPLGDPTGGDPGGDTGGLDPVGNDPLNDSGDAPSETPADSGGEATDGESGEAPAEAPAEQGGEDATPTNTNADATTDAESPTGDNGSAAAADGSTAGALSDAGATGAAGGATDRHDPVRLRELEEYAPLHQDELGSQINDALFEGGLLEDETQPAEFRGAWDTILGAYLESGIEVASYLESAFRVVTEAAVLYRDSETAADALDLVLGDEVPAAVASEAQLLLDDLALARDEVRQASSALEAVIQSAAQAGAAERFDQVLEDLLSAALERLMDANAALYMETHAVAAVVAALREPGATTIEDPARVQTLAREARAAANGEIAEMRKRWDRVAQDVFSAFVARLVATNTPNATSADAPVQPPSLADMP